MIRFNVADIAIEIISTKLYKPNKLESFYSSNKKLSDLKINIDCSPFIPKPKNLTLSSSEINWSHSTSMDSAYIYNDEADKVLLSLSVNKNYDSASITYLKDYCDDEYAISGPIGEILFRNRILFSQGLVIHSAAIDYQGKGIIFSAPAGTGKSTQARLWKEHIGASILNGDRPAIRVVNNKPIVYGTPWSGSSTDFKNCCAPLAAIIMLEQAAENSITKLDKSKAVIYLMPRCFLPYQSSELMTSALDNLDMLIKNTPIYLLKCKPDKEAVELVYECVK